MHLLRQCMDKFKATPLLRMLRREGAASLHLVLWGHFLSAATCRTPKTSSCHPVTPPDSANAPSLRHRSPKPFNTQGPACSPSVRGSACTHWPLAGKPEGKPRHNLTVTLSSASLAVLQGKGSPHVHISPPQGVAGIALVAFLFYTAVTSP